MTKSLLSLAVVALFALPASAQPGPGVAPAPQANPTVAPPQGGPGFGPGVDGTVPAAPTPAAAKPAAAKPPVPAVYDESADAKADVAAALAKAKKEKKRVLVTLGANWCGWCRKLDGLFTKDEKIAPALAKSYVPVKVDVGRMTKNLDLAASWGVDPKKGVPLLVVIDEKGNAVKVPSTETLESGKGYDTAKVLAFLETYAGH